ncbi:MAG: hypothetical protein IPK16_30560 [Anaerolineales bacterium]|nr:hypothetical protein [Anaerolineales bacterium]
MSCAGVTTSLIEHNVIAYNAGGGIVIEPDYRFGNDGMNFNRIHANAIYSNTGLGINLYPPPFGFVDGVTANDANDADTGGNALQNFPVLQWAESNGVSTVVSGTLASIANQPFAIEFFGNAAGDASGNGEGERYLGVITLTTNASGNAVFFTVLPAGVAGGGRVTATATDANGNTSELSAHIAVAPASGDRTLSVAPTATALSSTWLTVYTPFGGDANRNNYTVCEYATAATGPASPTPDSGQPGDAAWRYCTPTGLTPNTDYYVRHLPGCRWRRRRQSAGAWPAAHCHSSGRQSRPRSGHGRCAGHPPARDGSHRCGRQPQQRPCQHRGSHVAKRPVDATMRRIPLHVQADPVPYPQPDPEH